MQRLVIFLSLAVVAVVVIIPFCLLFIYTGRSLIFWLIKH